MGTEVVTPQRRLAIGDTAYHDLVNFRGELLTLSGSEQTTDAYLAALRDFLSRLAEFPHRGEARPDLHPSIRAIGFRQRLRIVFAVLEDQVLILAVQSARQGRVTLPKSVYQSLEVIDGDVR